MTFSVTGEVVAYFKGTEAYAEWSRRQAEFEREIRDAFHCKHTDGILYLGNRGGHGQGATSKDGD